MEMVIHFERTGGFAGMRMTATVDTESLSPEEAHDLHEMVDAAGFFDLPAEITTPTPGTDRFHYKLTVEAEGRQHTVDVAEAAVPEALWPLLQQLVALARSSRGSVGS
jgi:hypothetical protein